MRPIKFRGLSLATGEMIIGGGIDTQRDTPVIINQGVRFFVDKNTVGQFTGLTDKNGVDIYEGDIVSILFTDWPSQPKNEERSLDEYLKSLEKVFPVCFHKGAFQISGKGYYGNDIGYDDIECGKHGYIKVIGNIYQSPELLESV